VDDAATSIYLSYTQLAPYVGSTFHVTTAEGPIVLLLVSAAPLENELNTCTDQRTDQPTVKLAWRGPRQPRLPDQALLHHPALPPLHVQWTRVTSEAKYLLYEAIM
jgi:hypothetical protein